MCKRRLSCTTAKFNTLRTVKSRDWVGLSEGQHRLKCPLYLVGVWLGCLAEFRIPRSIGNRSKHSPPASNFNLTSCHCCTSVTLYQCHQTIRTCVDLPVLNTSLYPHRKSGPF